MNEQRLIKKSRKKRILVVASEEINCKFLEKLCENSFHLREIKKDKYEIVVQYSYNSKIFSVKFVETTVTDFNSHNISLTDIGSNKFIL